MDLLGNNNLNFSPAKVAIKNLTATSAANIYKDTSISAEYICREMYKELQSSNEFDTNYVPQIQAIVNSDKSFFKKLGDVVNFLKGSPEDKPTRRPKPSEELNFAG